MRRNGHSFGMQWAQGRRTPAWSSRRAWDAFLPPLLSPWLAVLCLVVQWILPYPTPPTPASAVNPEDFSRTFDQSWADAGIPGDE